MWNVKMKDLRFIMVIVTMMAVTLFVPWEANAADVSVPTDAALVEVVSSGEIITIDTCVPSCQGHHIKSNGTEIDAGIVVTGGTHDIYLENINFGRNKGDQDTGKCAFEINATAMVNLYLVGTNTLQSGPGRAGIYVPGSRVDPDQDAKLVVKGSGTLNVTGGPNGAGIGGEAFSPAGQITIEGGTVNAIGGFNGAAGIGGGNQSGAGTIRIKSGTVNAKGGDWGPAIGKGGSGIGYGSAADASGRTGSIIITGGTVEATGGSSATYQTFGDGLAAMYLSSDEKSANNVTGSLTSNPMDMSDFNGIIRSGTGYTVYGKAHLGSEGLSGWTSASRMDIPNGSSLTMDDRWYVNGGRITGSGRIYNSERIYGISSINGPQKYPRPITSDMVRIAKQTYTGNEIKPEVIIADGSYTLEEGEGKDYTVTYENNKEKGMATALIRAVIGKDNPDYINLDPSKPLSVNFEIVAADLSKADVAVVSPSEATYNGKPYDGEPQVEVKVGNVKLPAADYQVEWQESEFIKAGKYTAIVKPTDTGNCTGSATATFTIAPKQLTIESATAQDREYDGTTKVSMEVSAGEAEGFKLKGIETGDDVRVETEGLFGNISAPDVREDGYGYVVLDPKNIKLVGDDADNYTVSLGSNNRVTLDPPVMISQLKHGTPVATGKSEASLEYDEKFACKINVTDPKPGATYRYRIEGSNNWQESSYFDNLDVNRTYDFYVRVDNNNNVLAPEYPADTYKFSVYIEKLDQEPPQSFQIAFKPNADGTSYTATMPERENVLYSFDGGQTWMTLEEGGNVKTNCEPGHPYTGQMKYIEDAIHKESEPRAVEATAPMEQVESPAISPNGGEFKGSQMVTMTCETRDAIIYYTLDGSDPVVDGDKTKRYSKPFEITDAVTVKAIAVKEYMKDSRATTAKFDLDDSLETRVVRTDLTKVEVPSSLKDAGYTSISDITAALSRVLTAHTGYTYQNIAYYDITVMVSNDRKTWREAKLSDFPDEGLTITVPYPTGTNKNSNDFIAAHMFTATDARLGIEAGGIEEPDVTKTANGLEMKVKGTSPLGVAWKAAAASDNNNGMDPSNGVNGSDDGSGANGTAARVQANSDNNNGSDSSSDGSGNGDGSTSDNDGSGSGSDASDGSGISGGLASLLPQTSDGRTILLWVVLALISAGIIASMKLFKRRS